MLNANSKQIKGNFTKLEMCADSSYRRKYKNIKIILT